MSGHRQAAAALHALGEQDRKLILEQLPATDQATLRGYLSELVELGFESGNPATAQAARDVAREKPRDLLSASARTMFALLEHEPAALVAEVLAAQPWRWASGVMALYGPAQREAIHAARIRPAPARTNFLLVSLSGRLAGAEADGAPVRMPASFLAPFLNLGKAWRR